MFFVFCFLFFVFCFLFYLATLSFLSEILLLTTTNNNNKKVSLNSCICIECFRQGDHEGHDYYLHASSGGGCCDCGDPAAWDPKGFCCVHAGLTTNTIDISSSSPVFSSFEVGSPLSSSPAFSSHPLPRHGANQVTLTTVARDVVRLLMEHLTLCIDALLENRKGSKYYSLTRIEQIASWGYEICTFGDNIRRLFCEVVASTVVLRDATFAHLYDSSHSFLNEFFENGTLSHALEGEQVALMPLLLQGACFLQNNAGDSLCNFVLDMLHDSVFKVLFSKVYVNNYLHLLPFIMGITDEKKTKAIDSTLSTIVVQLFTSADLACFLVKDENFMTPVLECLQMFFFQCSIADEQGNLLVDCRSEMIQKEGYSRFFSDLGDVLKFPNVTEYLIFHAPGLVESFLGSISVLHNMNSNSRRVLDHVEYEHDDWKSAFMLEQRIRLLIPYFVQGLAHRRKGLEGGQESYGTMAEETRKALAPFLTNLLGLRERDVQGVQGKVRVEQYGEVKFSSYSVSTQPVSFHLPVHRLFGAFLRELVRGKGKGEKKKEMEEKGGSIKENICKEEGSCSAVASIHLSDFFDISDEEVLFMMSHPARVRAIMAQIQAGMWRRNGEVTMHGQLQMYLRPLISGESLAQDMMILQASAVLLPAPSFLLSLLEHFGLNGWFAVEGKMKKDKNDNEEEDEEEEEEEEEQQVDETYNLIVAERFLHLVLSIVANRHMAGDEDPLRSHIIQWLCVNNQNFSNLVNRLSMEVRLTQTRDVEALLREVAIRKPARAVSGRRVCGGYELKKELWKEFDPAFLYYDQHHLQNVFENFASLSALAKEPFVLPMRDVSSLSPLLPMMAPLPKVVHSAFFHRILFAILYQGVAQTAKYSDKILDMTLYLLLVILQLPIPPEAKTDPAETFSPPPSSPSLPEEPKKKVQIVITFPSAWNFMINFEHKVETPQGCYSLLSMLCELLERKDLKSRQETIRFVLDSYKKLSPECERAVRELFEEEEKKRREAEGGGGGEEGMKRKAAVMAKFSKMQAQFHDFMDFSDEDSEEEDEEMEEEGGEGGSGKEGEEGEKEEEKKEKRGREMCYGRELGRCELCKEERGGRGMGMLGLLTRSNVVSLANRKARYGFAHEEEKGGRGRGKGELSARRREKVAEKKEVGIRGAKMLQPSQAEKEQVQQLMETFQDGSLEDTLGLARGLMEEGDEEGSGRAVLSVLLSYFVRQNLRERGGGMGVGSDSSDEEEEEEEEEMGVGRFVEVGDDEDEGMFCMSFFFLYRYIFPFFFFWRCIFFSLTLLPKP